jgi:hypothetical protein
MKPTREITADVTIGPASENYYFYEDSDDKEGFFSVFYGNNGNEFQASFIAEFANEDDACEYVDWQNERLCSEVDSVYDELNEFDEEGELLEDDDIADLVDELKKGYSLD